MNQWDPKFPEKKTEEASPNPEKKPEGLPAAKETTSPLGPTEAAVIPLTPPSSDPIRREGHPEEGPPRKKLRGTAAMDPATRKEVARKGGLAVSRNRQHMSEIGRKVGQSVSKNREHMAQIGKKGGESSRGSR